MAPRRLFPGFPGIKEAPHLFKPPLRLQRERETPLTTILAILKRRTPPRYIYTYIHILFVSLSRETRKFRSILETKEGRDDKPIIASRRRRGSSNRFQFTGRQSLAGQMGKQSWGRCSTIISVLESRTSSSPSKRTREEEEASIEPNDTVINVRVQLFPRNFASIHPRVAPVKRDSSIPNERSERDRPPPSRLLISRGGGPRKDWFP